MDTETQQLMADMLTLIADLAESVEQLESTQFDPRMQGNRVRPKSTLRVRAQALLARLNGLPKTE